MIEEEKATTPAETEQSEQPAPEIAQQQRRVTSMKSLVYIGVRGRGDHPGLLPPALLSNGSLAGAGRSGGRFTDRRVPGCGTLAHPARKI